MIVVHSILQKSFQILQENMGSTILPAVQGTPKAMGWLSIQGRSRWSGRSGHGRTGFGPQQKKFQMCSNLLQVSN